MSDKHRGSDLRDGNLVLIGPFAQTSVAASQTAVALAVDAPSCVSITSIKAPAPGYILAVIAHSDQTVAAGTAAFSPTIGGTAQSMTATLSTAATTSAVSTLPANKTAVQFTTGDLLGVKVTTNSAFRCPADANTGDVAVWLLVGFDVVALAND